MCHTNKLAGKYLQIESPSMPKSNYVPNVTLLTIKKNIVIICNMLRFYFIIE